MIDSRVLPIVLSEIEKTDGNYKILIMPDHPTPLMIRTHTSDPVPFMIYDSSKSVNGDKFTEENAAKTGFLIEKGIDLMPYFLK